MSYTQFSNLSCYEEFEIKSALTGISKIDVLKELGCQINDYYFFISNDGIFNGIDLEGNHIKDPGILKKIKEEYIHKNITKCIIPDSVTSINDYAFSHCGSLTSVTLPNCVTSIGAYAFYGCRSLKSITIPNSVTSIGHGVFPFCESLKEIIIPNSVTSIGNGVFSFCESLKEVIFKVKTLEEVKQMSSYPFGVKDESIIKVSEI